MLFVYDTELKINLTYQYAKKLHCYNYWNYVGLSLAISRRSSRRKSEIGTSTLGSTLGSTEPYPYM